MKTAQVIEEIAKRVADVFAKRHSGFGYTADQFIRPLGWFLEDHSDKSPEQLAEIAQHLTPGGAHDDGFLVRLVRANLFGADDRLVAAVMYHAWHGGKAGFQFLPDPASMPLEDYECEVAELQDVFEWGGGPLSFLTNKWDRDRDFYDALPERIRIYRGAAGISHEQAAAGVCWSTRRDIAEWFADRSRFELDTERVLVGAWVRKDWIWFARACEHEVVVVPHRFQALKCEPRKKPSDMTWGTTDREDQQRIQAIGIMGAPL